MHMANHRDQHKHSSKHGWHEQCNPVVLSGMSPCDLRCDSCCWHFTPHTHTGTQNREYSHPV